MKSLIEEIASINSTQKKLLIELCEIATSNSTSVNLKSTAMKSVPPYERPALSKGFLLPEGRLSVIPNTEVTIASYQCPLVLVARLLEKFPNSNLSYMFGLDNFKKALCSFIFAVPSNFAIYLTE